jgi:hypothetical protein
MSNAGGSVESCPSAVVSAGPPSRDEGATTAVNTKTTIGSRLQTLALVLMTCVMLAVIAGLLAHAYHRDPVPWAAWTFGTFASLGVSICFGVWMMEG